MNSLDRQYLDLANKILTRGRRKGDRTGTGTISIFDATLDHDMNDGFPLLTTKKVWFKGVLHELLWFLKGDTNIQYLEQNNVHIWLEWPYKAYVKECAKIGLDPFDMKTFGEKVATDDEFAARWGDVGKVYGAQWTKWTDTTVKASINDNLREYRELNQIDVLINTLKTNPDDRRMLVTAWNPAEVRTALLPPCHYGFQCYSEELTLGERIVIADSQTDNLFSITSNPSTIEVKLNEMNIPKRRLSLKWLIRSCDHGLGNPFDTASYALLLLMLSHVTNHQPHRCIGSYGDLHIYSNHITAMEEQLKRDSFPLPQVKIKRKVNSIYDFKFDDFELLNYQSHASIKMDVAV